MTAKEFLRQAYRLNAIINSNVAELAALRELAASIPVQSFDRDKLSSAGYVSSKVEDTVIKICMYEKQVSDEIEHFIKLKQEIRCAIMNVKNYDQQYLLRLHYLECLPWPDVQDKMDLSERAVYRIHAEALKSVQVPSDYQTV